MPKIFTYIVIMTGIVLLLLFAGMPTASRTMLDAFNINVNQTGSGEVNGVDVSGFNDVSASAIITLLGLFLTMSAGAALIVGWLATKSPIDAIIAGFMITLAGWITADTISIINVANSFEGIGAWISYGVFLVMIPLLIGMYMALIDWWRGTDG